MQADREVSGVSDVAPSESAATAGYIVTQAPETSTYEYAVAVDEVMAMVRLSDPVFGEAATAVRADLIERTHAHHSALAQASAARPGHRAALRTHGLDVGSAYFALFLAPE